MSNVNIKRAVENIRANTTVYTPVVETIVNAVQAIAELGNSGTVLISALRSGQLDLPGSLPDITGFTVRDDGIGFTDAHRQAFDTLYTDHRLAEGGKGFGRFTCLKYFDELHVDSVYSEGSQSSPAPSPWARIKTSSSTNWSLPPTRLPPARCISHRAVSLIGLKDGPTFEKKLETVARNLVERLLPYFITEGYACPKIVIAEQDGSRGICLNEFVSNQVSAFIQEMPVHPSSFALKSHDSTEEFKVRVFKVYSPGSQKSRISLVAHRREVSGSSLERYIPEFSDEFYDEEQDNDATRGRNYIVRAYAFSHYLDHNVSLERGTFEFGMEADVLFGISQVQIEAEVAGIAQEAVGRDIALRKNRKRERVQRYVDEEAPWHKEIIRTIDLRDLPHKPTPQQIESCLQQEKLKQEQAIKGDVAKLLSEDSFADLQDTVIDIVGKISGTSKNDLIHYIALRRKILDIFGKSLELDESGSYSSEGVVHDIVFPRKGDTDATPFEDHNLWIIDERLNFTKYVSSDLPLDGARSGRPDLLVYDNRVLFRGDNEESNPVTIFEFKRPPEGRFRRPI